MLPIIYLLVIWTNGQHFTVSFLTLHKFRYFDIQGQHTGLTSRALRSPCGKICIPLNEPKDEMSQIKEFTDEYKGEGIQHIALSTDDIYKTVETLRERGQGFLNTPDTYYRMVEDRLPKHNEDLERMQKNKVLGRW